MDGTAAEHIEPGYFDEEDETPAGKQRKLRAGARRDAELIRFAREMAKESQRSNDVQSRRDAKYWTELAIHIETTHEDGTIRDRPAVWTTRRLEFLTRAVAGVTEQRDAEVLALREDGAPWDAIAAATGLTREGARRKWTPK